MRGAFDDREMEPARQGRDTELTLSSMTLLGIFFGLVLLCGLCFGLGYSLGRRNLAGPAVALQPEANAQTVAQVQGSHAKPSASAVPQAQTPPSDSAAGLDAGIVAPVGAQSSASPGSAPLSAQPAIHPAPGAASNTPLPASSQAAPPPAGSLMVQVATVSNQEDADVLSGALRKRGYPVNERRDPGDGMVHVRVGPFTSRDDANKWRMKLLNDGYNAILQP